MELTKIDRDSSSYQNEKLTCAYDQLDSLLSALAKKEIPDEIIVSINDKIEHISHYTASEKDSIKRIKKTQLNILKLVEKELKIIPKNHYRNTWLALGMATFGIPLGVVFGTSFGNMAFLGIGLPIGMVIGLAVGTGLDKKARDEGRQIDFDIG